MKVVVPPPSQVLGGDFQVGWCEIDVGGTNGDGGGCQHVVVFVRFGDRVI